jgi:hypothetical protein
MAIKSYHSYRPGGSSEVQAANTCPVFNEPSQRVLTVTEVSVNVLLSISEKFGGELEVLARRMKGLSS